MKVVVNRCFGGYQLSKKAYEFLGLEWDGWGIGLKEDRTNPKLVECVETLGEDANGAAGELEVVEIPDGVDYEISEYDGVETIHERHRSW